MTTSVVVRDCICVNGLRFTVFCRGWRGVYLSEELAGWGLCAPMAGVAGDPVPDVTLIYSCGSPSYIEGLCQHIANRWKIEMVTPEEFDAIVKEYGEARRRTPQTWSQEVGAPPSPSD